MAKCADTYIYHMCNEADTVVNETATVESIVDILIDARTKLMENNVANASDIVIEVTPEIAGMILKAKVALSTDNGETLENGCLGSIGGCKIFVSNNLIKSETDNGKIHKCVVRTKRAIAFAEQISEVEAYRPELRFADAVKGLHLYGAKVVYPKEMVALNLTVA